MAKFNRVRKENVRPFNNNNTITIILPLRCKIIILEVIWKKVMSKLCTEDERLPHNPAFIRHPSPRANICDFLGNRHL